MTEYDEADTCWSIMTVTHGGTVSLLKDLDAPTARKVYRKLKPDSQPIKYINRPENGSGGWSHGGIRSISDGDITRVEVIGPDGAELDPWKGVEPRVVDLGAYRSVEEEMAARQRRYNEAEKEALSNLDTVDKVIAAWFERYVSQYPGATQPARELFDGVVGRTLKRFANQYATGGVNIRQKDMERWLDAKGIRSRGAMGLKHYDGIRVVVHGNVKTGSYGT